MKSCDLFVIGGGSGGIRAARLAAKLGKKVILAEKSYLGGTCVNVGCVPKKLFYYAAKLAEECEHAKHYGWTNDSLGKIDIAHFIANKDKEIARLNDIYEKNLRQTGVEIIFANASLSGANTVIANEETYHAKHILLACGGFPHRLSITGMELMVTSDDLFFLSKLPRRVVIIGGGYIALEFAGIFSGFGVETTLAYRSDLPMRGLDDDMRAHLAENMTYHGINIVSGVRPSAVYAAGEEKKLMFDDGTSIVADLVVSAIGRYPASRHLGLEKLDIRMGKNGTIQVNESYQTSCPSIYAVGDLLDNVALTPVAIAEAEIFIQHLYKNRDDTQVNYDNVPTAIFSRPAFACAGLSEYEAKRRGYDISVYSSAFRPMKKSFVGSEEKSYIKLITDQKNGRVLGAQMLGEDAPEIMQGVAIAISAGATKDIFNKTIGIHPTSAEEFVTL